MSWTYRYDKIILQFLVLIVTYFQSQQKITINKNNVYGGAKKTYLWFSSLITSRMDTITCYTWHIIMFYGLNPMSQSYKMVLLTMVVTEPMFLQQAICHHAKNKAFTSWANWKLISVFINVHLNVDHSHQIPQF
jgi:hypothetical protein